MANEPSIPLREYFEKINELQNAANERALVVQSVDIERRLSALNELRKEVTDDREQFVKREVFDLSVREVRSALEMATKENLAYRDRVELRMGTLETRQTKSETRAITWTTAIGLFIIIVQIIIHLLPSFK